MAYPAPRFYGRPCLVHRATRRASLLQWSCHLVADFDLLDTDLRRLVWDGRGDRHRDAVPVWNKLGPVLGLDGKHPPAAHGLRKPDGILSRGLVPGCPAVRAPARPALGPLLRRLDGGRRDAHVVLLDLVGEQLDANAGWIQGR